MPDGGHTARTACSTTPPDRLPALRAPARASPTWWKRCGGRPGTGLPGSPQNLSGCTPSPWRRPPHPRASRPKPTARPGPAGRTLLVEVVEVVEGGVGSAVVEIAAAQGATVIGTASERNHSPLPRRRSHYLQPRPSTAPHRSGTALRRPDTRHCGSGSLVDLVAITGDPTRVATVADQAGGWRLGTLHCLWSTPRRGRHGRCRRESGERGRRRRWRSPRRVAPCWWSS